MLATRKQRILLLLALVISILQTAMAQEECTLKKEKDGIRVYSCKTKAANLNTVRAEFDLYTSVEQYLQLVRNVENYKNWHFRVMEPAELKRDNDNNIIYHTQISAPWPVSNRDLILNLQLQIEKDGSLFVVLESLPEYIPEKEGFVRIPFSYSEMRMTPVSTNHLKVDYWIKADPGGSLPDWVTNMVSTQGPYETFKRMKEILESDSEYPSDQNGANQANGQR